MNSAVTDATSRLRRVELTHIDGLDGLRGLAVIAVVLYHGGVSWDTGGFLGVELFFVLSGFLITSLLVREWLSSGTVVLSNFWARRARRLLPALFVLVVVIGIYYALRGTQGSVPGLFGDGLSAIFYYSNWHQIAAGTGYFVQSSATSPFQHTWSLAIEEQFYLVWPLLFLGVAFMLMRSRRDSPGVPSERQAARMLNAMLGISLLLLVASAADAAWLFHGGSGQNRVYFGTDTRAYGLLSGAALAITMARLRLSGRGQSGSFETGGTRAERSAPRPRSRVATLATPIISLGSAVVLACVIIAMIKANGNAHYLYPWGFLAIDGFSVALIAVTMTTPRSIANRIFCLEPLRWVGKISYGLYLWHFPLFLWLTEAGTGLNGTTLLIVRILASLAVSVLSYYIVEQPIRQRRWPVWMVRSLAPITAGAGVVALALAANAAAIPATASVAPPVVQTHLAGTDPPCSVSLSNTKLYGAVAPPVAQQTTFTTDALYKGTVTWPTASTTTSFTTCPPKRALMVGDSIAFTLGVPMLYDEQKYGMAIADAAILGCSFGVQGQLDVGGTWENPPKGCPNEINTWAAQAQQFGAQEIIVELGYRDEFNWKWNGKIVHLGETAFDNYVLGRIKQFIKVIGDNGKRKVLFMSVPYVDPAANPDGSAAVQGSTARHNEINALLRQAAASDGSNAAVFSVDKYLDPDNKYTSKLNGQQCRLADGIHPSAYCAEVLEPYTFEAARGLLGN